MLKDLFSNRLFIGALAFFVLMIVGGTLYLRHIQRQDQIELERTQERLQQWQVRQKQPEKVPEGDTVQGGHVHSDGTWHDQPHETPAVTPEAVFESLSDAELAEIPEDMPKPDIPLPADLKNIDLQDWKEWVKKHSAEWNKYIHALDPGIERLDKEAERLLAALPPKDSPDYAAALAKYNKVSLAHNGVVVEKSWRIHEANAARQSAREKYHLARYGKK